MKRAEIIEKLKKGEKIYWTEWNGKTYSIGMKKISWKTAQWLIEQKLVISLRSKTSPLTGILKWKEAKAEKK